MGCLSQGERADPVRGGVILSGHAEGIGGAPPGSGSVLPPVCKGPCFRPGIYGRGSVKRLMY